MQETWKYPFAYCLKNQSNEYEIMVHTLDQHIGLDGTVKFKLSDAIVFKKVIDARITAFKLYVDRGNKTYLAVAFSNGYVILFSNKHGEFVYHSDVTVDGTNNYVNAITFIQPLSQIFIVIALANGNIQFCQIHMGEGCIAPLKILEGKEPITHMVHSNNQQYLIIVTGSKNVRILYQFETDKVKEVHFNDPICSLASNLESTFVALGHESKISILDLSDGDIIYTFALDGVPPIKINSMSFSLLNTLAFTLEKSYHGTCTIPDIDAIYNKIIIPPKVKLVQMDGDASISILWGGHYSFLLKKGSIQIYDNGCTQINNNGDGKHIQQIDLPDNIITSELLV